MAKKKFSDGLDDLFRAADEHHGEAMGGALSEMTVRQGGESRRPTSSKSFAHDIDALLHEALEESLERLDNPAPDTAKLAGKSKTRHDAPESLHASGLDNLIRQTIDVQQYIHDEATGVRRLTVTVDRTKLDKLKTIARLENAYLKDLLSGVIDEFITEYVQEKGVKL